MKPEAITNLHSLPPPRIQRLLFNACRVLAAIMIFLTATDNVDAEPSVSTITSNFALSRLDARLDRNASADILAGKMSERFLPIDPSQILPSRDHGIWLRLTFLSDWELAEPAVISLHSVRSSIVTLYPPDVSSAVSVSRSINGVNNPARFTRDALYFPVGNTLKKGSVVYIFVDGIVGGTARVMGLQVADMETVNIANLNHSRIVTLVVGALGVLGLTSLLMWLGLREAPLIYFALFVLFQAIYNAFFFGEGYSLPGLSSLSSLGTNASGISATIAMGFCCLFFRSLLDLPLYSKRFSWILKSLAIFYFVLALFLLPSSGAVQQFLYALGNAVILLTAILNFIVAVIIARQGNQAALYVLAAWIIMQIFGVWRTWSLLRGEAENPMLYYGFPISMVIGSSLLALALADRARRQKAELFEVKQHAVLDALTGIDNRRSITDKLRTTCQSPAKLNNDVSVLYLDLDHFKAVNDTYGHPIGDICLKAVVDRAQQELRDGDSIGRLGGEEFLIVLPGAKIEAAHMIAERIRARICELPVTADGVKISVTVSVGVASALAHASLPETLIKNADLALYAAKHAGRNQVKLAA
jgi:two-component system, sensor histidine kinase LadS